MILLDSDHLTVLRYKSGERALRLTKRLVDSGDPIIGTTVANVEEAMRGWLAAIAKERDARRQIPAYRELGELFIFFAGFAIAPFDAAAVDHFEVLRQAKLGMATMDRKVAAIALAHQALLLTANRRDFERVPELRFENWMD